MPPSARLKHRMTPARAGKSITEGYAPRVYEWLVPPQVRVLIEDLRQRDRVHRGDHR